MVKWFIRDGFTEIEKNGGFSVTAVAYDCFILK